MATPLPVLGTRLRNRGSASRFGSGIESYWIRQSRLPWAADNTPSIRVMERIGMVPHKKRYFLHPSLEKSHPLCKHVLYQKERRHHERDRHDLENGRAR